MSFFAKSGDRDGIGDEILGVSLKALLSLEMKDVEEL
jgi:hypothetical protein